ncbi:uncharacterized protein [Dysidea avara]|uniref:uncharacterized protein n=1 Tax=Dysidea avara TaxID=196820 RepID=UPI00333078F9
MACIHCNQPVQLSVLARVFSGRQQYACNRQECLEDQQLRERETVEHQRRVDENETLRLQNEAAIASQNATHRQREDENQRRRLQNETRRLHNEAAIAVERAAHQQREDEHKKLHLENEKIRLLNEAEDRKMTNELARLSLGDDRAKQRQQAEERKRADMLVMQERKNEELCLKIELIKLQKNEGNTCWQPVQCRNDLINATNN